MGTLRLKLGQLGKSCFFRWVVEVFLFVFILFCSVGVFRHFLGFFLFGGRVFCCFCVCVFGGVFMLLTFLLFKFFFLFVLFFNVVVNFEFGV